MMKLEEVVRTVQGISDTVARHDEAIQNLQRGQEELRKELHQLREELRQDIRSGFNAVNEELKSQRSAMDNVTKEALNSAPPWAVRQIASLRFWLGITAGAFVTSVGWLVAHGW